ncbi:cobalamin B12-binding domain-containing protein [uncultured Desulfosarcina sp.]|uniref:cobalamin B12-binding domain-containing protein n=1 Tax=uncultured Desulfosarcina sp. TaxID=218289 RepID=UPI0029C63D87|nr:cobalamin B12-binding domain-containing protein [uncultured Desulfosarcina sp.]
MADVSNAPIKVLIAKAGLDGHEQGARAISFGLRDEGMEVIYTGIRQSVESIVQAVIQEDVDVLGLSSLAGAHNLLPEIIDQIKEKGRTDVLVIAGGIIPTEDIPFLTSGGVSAIFTPGATIKEIAQYIRDNVMR